ncbi:MAG: shikimate kinase [Bacteroidales bacterium]|nr:shikimate kinase [Bacteroidales bacterium]
MRIFLVGFMGAGKSVIGRRLAKSLDLSFYDLDEEIESRYKMSVSSIFQKYDEACFRKLETTVLESFSEKDKFVLSCGGGTPCFGNNMELMNSLGTTIYIKVQTEELSSRISASYHKRPLTEGKSDAELADYVAATLKAREPFYAKSKITVDATGTDKDALTEKIVANLQQFNGQQTAIL